MGQLQIEQIIFESGIPDAEKSNVEIGMDSAASGKGLERLEGVKDLEKELISTGASKS